MDKPDVGYLLNRATRRFRARLGVALADTGLRPQQAAALMAVGRSRHQLLTPGAVGDAIDADPATTSGLLDRLTRDGWLVSEPNPADRRSRLVRLTPKADAILPAVLQAARTVSAEATSSLTPAEIDTLASLLQRLVDEGEDGR